MLIAIDPECFTLLINFHSASVGSRDFLKPVLRKGQVNEGEKGFRYNQSVKDEREACKCEEYLKVPHNNQYEHFPNCNHF